MALKVKVLSQYCKSCGYCVHFCPQHVLAFGKTRNAIGAFFPVADIDKCVGCGICATVCPDSALEIREEENNG
jgi:2-oxoglutarate ferredoxin oxidoreductase subunit delta